MPVGVGGIVCAGGGGKIGGPGSAGDVDAAVGAEGDGNGRIVGAAAKISGVNDVAVRIELGYKDVVARGRDQEQVGAGHQQLKQRDLGRSDD
jgi:hypothetical protein